jgi:hypothetical protein
MTQNTANEYPVQLLEYLVNLSEDPLCTPFILMDEYVFSTYFTALLQGLPVDSSNEALSKILADIIPGFDLEAFETLDSINNLEKQEKLMQIVNNLRHQFSENITTTYVRDFVLSSEIYRTLLSTYKTNNESSEALKKIVNAMFDVMRDNFAGRISSITINIQRLTDAIKLSVAEGKLMEMNLLFSVDIRAAIFRDFLFAINRNSSLLEHFYKVMLGINQSVDGINDCLSDRSKPIALGIVNYDAKSKRLPNMSDFWVYALSHYTDNEDKFFERFLEPLREKKKSSSGSIAKASVADELLLSNFLKQAYDAAEDASYVSKSDSSVERVTDMIEKSLGLNVMFYGSRRLDKMSYVVNMLKEHHGFKPMKIRTKDAKSSDIPAICYVAQQRAKHITVKDMPVILIIEKADQALTRGSSSPSWFLDMFGNDGTSSSNKDDDLTSDELLMIKNPVPSIWLVDSPSSVSTDNVGRFLLHVEMKGGSRADRREEVQKVVDELGFSPEIAMKLSKYVELNVEQIKSAARAVQLLGLKGPEGEANLFHVIANSQRALNREKMEELRDSVTKYSLDLLNLSGNVPVDKIIQALKKRPSGTMCLYGPPGTGKTQLVEYMAMVLDMPLIKKRASDLLDKYVGESEKNIAAMFDEAKAEGAILLLDEADSFLRDRAMASKSWEVSQVNELLQRMENFNGIFICATNLFNSLDAAALRRFAFKLEFKPLTREQRLKMLINETGVDILAMDTTEHDRVVSTLNGIPHLTPGDFAVVRRQANLLCEEELSVDTWLERLAMESKAKLAGLERNGMGFIGGGEIAERRNDE